jgi:anaerobic magnesium-protoporphyrin IX monomethyl ester cyclase
MIKKVLLINLPFEKIYEKSNMIDVAPTTPPLALACLGGSLLSKGHIVEIFDFNIYTHNGDEEFDKKLKTLNPDYVGITFVTPLIKTAIGVIETVRKYNEDIIIIIGGPHTSSFPKLSLNETKADVGVFGEGDFTIIDIVEGVPYKDILGIVYEYDEQIIQNSPRPLIQNLDDLPLPALQLYDIPKYHVPAVIARKNPVAWIETSRGCLFGCVYCNKSCFGRTFRVKSPERVVKEFINAKNLGFKEIHLTDDCFTTKIDRAKIICDMLIEQHVDMIWSPITGIRVDKVDLELLQKMRQAGCYRVYFGIESGSQVILNKIKKGITLEMVEKAVKLAKQAKLEVAGFFMIGLPGETEETMQQTIDFAKKLNLDMSKISITIPLPATEMFNDLDTKGLIKTKNWEEFKFYTAPSTIYNHENLSWDIIEKYHKKFYRTVYLRPSFVIRKLYNSTKNKTLIEDIKIALKTIKF